MDSPARAKALREKLRRKESKRRLAEVQRQQEERQQRQRDVLQAAGLGNERTVLELIAPGDLDVNSADMKQACLVAAQRGFVSIVTALLKLGVTDARDATTNRRAVDIALLAAARDGTLSNVELLVAKAGDLTVKTEYGQNVLHLAVTRSHRRSMVEFVLERKKALLEESNPDGDTPFLAAVRHGHVENVEALLFAGADLHALAADGRNACQLAADMGHDALFDYLDEQFRMLDQARALKAAAERERDDALAAQRQAEAERDEALRQLDKAQREMAEAIQKQTAAEIERDAKLARMHDMEEERDKAVAEQAEADAEHERMSRRLLAAQRDLERARIDLRDLEEELRALKDERKCCYVLCG